jgi:hypothetical protein
MSDVVAVFTSKSVETILADGGSQSWALDRVRAARCDYLVVCRNANDQPEGCEPHGSAFLVGKISDVVASTETPGRFKINISHFAHVDWEDEWGGARNPVAYWKDSDYKDENGKIRDFKALEFHKVEDFAVKRASNGAPAVLTIAAAKAGLAASFNVPETAIEITIRA